jgi:hypothetical protein
MTSTAATWGASGSLTFAVDVEYPWQVPYDDMLVFLPILFDRLADVIQIQ